MDELLINYGMPKSKKMLNAVIGAYLVVFCLYFCITEGVASRFGVLFVCAAIGFVLALILVLGNTLWSAPPALKVNNETVESNPTGQKGITVNWANVSQVTLGMNYIVFHVNGGQKQQKVDLSYIVYKDVKDIKSKVIELCEYKNIPYKND